MKSTSAPPATGPRHRLGVAAAMTARWPRWRSPRNGAAWCPAALRQEDIGHAYLPLTFQSAAADALPEVTAAPSTTSTSEPLATATTTVPVASPTPGSAPRDPATYEYTEWSIAGPVARLGPPQ